MKVVCLLKLRPLYGLAADLGDPGGRADKAHHVPDTPQNEGEHHDEEEAADHPGLAVAAESCDHAVQSPLAERAVIAETASATKEPGRGAFQAEPNLPLPPPPC